MQSATDTPGKSQLSIQTIIQPMNSYNSILFNLLTNKTVELIDLISSGIDFHKVLPLYLLIFGP